MAEELMQVWREYADTRSIELRDKLTLSYTGLVKSLVRRMMPRYGAVAEYDDMISCGVLGLIDAVEKFDLKQNVKFETYAVTRVRGEILDFLRSQDWAPASLRRKISAVTDAYDLLEAQGDADVAEPKIAKMLDMTTEQVGKVLARAHMFNVLKFEDALGGSEDSIPEPRGSDDDIPENILLAKDNITRLAGIIEDLPERERQVVTLYYYEGLLLRDIAEVLGVTESRVSQMHSKIIAKMRDRLAD
ncbi:MAG: FliA/WhiG family RNA polymerase sigma factor [Oscillospiraceae bacterium]|jgi:RNA polymerase sigma factor for flagellar operon FliA|nr:FliA/WhiG family RNA polymerase sigma factor [Oscillospiraceae bacterium]